MKPTTLIPILLSALWISSPVLGASVSSPQAEPSATTTVPLKASTGHETQTRVAPYVILKDTVFTGSDMPAIGDPLGNHPVSPQDDAGPPLTQRLSYSADCHDEACFRAMKRWNSPTTWSQDRASGLSLGWGGRR